MGMFQCLGVPQQLLPFLICKSQGDSGELSCTHRTARPVIIHSLGIQLVLRLGIASDRGTCDSDSRALSFSALQSQGICSQCQSGTWRSLLFTSLQLLKKKQKKKTSPLSLFFAGKRTCNIPKLCHCRSGMSDCLCRVKSHRYSALGLGFVYRLCF